MPHTETRRTRLRILLAALAAVALALTASLALAATASADHCDPNADPNCGPHTPDPPEPIEQCPGTVGPVHAWPCPVRQTSDCAQAYTSPSTCTPVAVTVYSQSAGGVTTPTVSTPSVSVPVFNVWPTAEMAVSSATYTAGQVVCYVKTRDTIRCFNAGP